LNAAALLLRPFTIVRTRGLLTLTSDQTANSENQWIQYGHIVVTEQAVTAGVASIPTPITEASSDWHVFVPLATRWTVVSAIGVESKSTENMQYDSKAMRKVDLGEDLALLVEAAATGVSEGVQFRDFARILVKLH